MRSLPDSLPRVVARYRPASKFFPGRRRYDVDYRKELSRNAHRRRGIFVVIGVDTQAATHSLALVAAATDAVIEEAVFQTRRRGLTAR
jgi:transposase